MIGSEFFMQLALQQAWKYQGLTYPNPAVGAVVTKNTQILSIGAHRYAGGPHAEVNAIQRAFEQLSDQKIPHTDAADIHTFLLQNHGNLFHECTIYVTLEPCNHTGRTPSCAKLIKALGFKKVVIGTKDTNAKAAGGSERFEDFEIGVLESECKALLEPFVIWQKRAFVLYKLAQTHNGNISGGYITSKESLQRVHRIREKITQLLIGGNTVKIDRPTLDCRFVSNYAPDVQIYSDQKIDRSINLFNIKNRKVKIDKDLSYLQDPGFVMVEGGENMLKSLSGKIDWMLTFQAPSINTQQSYSIDMQLQHLWVEKNADDLMIWSRVKNG
ncbi:MAG: bifunctional diaminohydroxyphosphoribosylaminopyrimidine deaminase/5-amino-6-(5-phosphoribosylamino)uracil reductase RibD [Campylobacterota bacterium]